MKKRRLLRSDKDRLIAGVCGGIGAYLGVDANLVRAFFTLLFVLQPATALLYLLLVVLLPREGAEDQPLEERVRESARELEQRLDGIDLDLEFGTHDTSGRLWVGVGLVVLGVYLLLANLGLFWIDWGQVVALLLVGFGVYLLFARR
ncbi:PspC domain-containing protein [Oceanithermus sp.]